MFKKSWSIGKRFSTLLAFIFLFTDPVFAEKKTQNNPRMLINKSEIVNEWEILHHTSASFADRL